MNDQILDDSNDNTSTAGCAFTCNRRFSDMPKECEFPAKVKLKDGLMFWLHSHNMNDAGSTKIKLF